MIDVIILYAYYIRDNEKIMARPSFLETIDVLTAVYNCYTISVLLPLTRDVYT